MNESITCEEVLHLARHLHACMDEVVKSLQLLAAGADGAVLSECTTCDGDGGWWVTVPPQRAVGRIRCEHCEGTGVEPGPAVQRTLDVEEYL